MLPLPGTLRYDSLSHTHRQSPPGCHVTHSHITPCPVADVYDIKPAALGVALFIASSLKRMKGFFGLDGMMLPKLPGSPSQKQVDNSTHS